MLPNHRFLELRQKNKIEDKSFCRYQDEVDHPPPEVDRQIFSDASTFPFLWPWTKHNLEIMPTSLV